MQILFLTPQVPYPPRQGTSIRNYNLIAHLAQRHTVDLLTFMAPGDEMPPDSPLYQHCRRIGTVPQPARSTTRRLSDLLRSPLPDMALRLESPAMHQLMTTWITSTQNGAKNAPLYDIVQIEGIELAQYANHVDRNKSAVLFDNHNCEYLLQQRNALTDLRNPRRWHAAAYSLVQWAKLHRYEAAVCRAAQAVVAVSQPDRVALQHIAPSANIHVAPNGINLAAYETGERMSAQRDPNRFTLLFTGKMDYRPNIDAVLWFADQVLPLLVNTVPNIHFQVVGMNPHPRLDRLRNSPHIEITGAVPAITPYLDAADAYGIPMRVGGGTRFKALEAMAARKAIVSTRLGIEGIDVRDAHEMLLADSPKSFAAAILRLVDDKRQGAPLAKELGETAHAFVAAHYTWQQIIPTFDQIYAQIHATLQPRQSISSDPPLQRVA
jgi:glycosyltransferase involved in cell wall biosynthesis